MFPVKYDKKCILFLLFLHENVCFYYPKYLCVLAFSVWKIFYVNIFAYIWLGKQMRVETDVAANTWLALSTRSWLLTGPCAAVIMGGWERFTVSFTR